MESLAPRRYRRLARLALALLALAVLALTLVPAASPDLPHPVDKVAHFEAFVLLAGLGWIAAGSRFARLFAVALLALLGAGIEVAQAFVPGADPSLADLAADAAGIGFGILLARDALRLTRPMATG